MPATKLPAASHGQVGAASGPPASVIALATYAYSLSMFYKDV
jgi:hypothetical protein